MFLVPKPHMFRKWSNMAHGKNYFHEKKLHHLGKIKQGSDSERMKGTTILVWSGDYIFCTCTHCTCRIERDPAVRVCVPVVYGCTCMYVYTTYILHSTYIHTTRHVPGEHVVVSTNKFKYVARSINKYENFVMYECAPKFFRAIL